MSLSSTLKVSETNFKPTKRGEFFNVKAKQFNALIDAINDLEVIQSDVARVKLTLTSAQIKTLNSVPVKIIDAPGSGKFIEVVSGVVFYTFNTTAFTNGIVEIRTSGLSVRQGVSGTILTSTSDSNTFINRAVAASANSSQVQENTNIMVTSPADSEVGDGTITIYLTYRIVTL